MVNEYVKDNIYNESHHPDSVQDDENMLGQSDMLPPDQWQGYYSDDLYNMWSKVKDYLHMSGAGAYMLEDATFADFAHFCYQRSSGVMYSNAVGH